MTANFACTLRRLVLCAAPFILVFSLASAPARAQNAAPPAQAQTEQTLSKGQIEQLVAPIALYPDPLLTQVLMASTYPLEVVEAARWSQDNVAVKGAALGDAMQAQSWDPSVKALTAVPQTLLMMNDKLDWTQQLGDAFLAQQQDLLAAVQTLRAEAQAAGNLQSTPQQMVTTEAPAAGSASGSGQPPIVIEPVNPEVYYVPVYDPAAAYGAWSYPDYPPFYWSPPGFVASNVVSPALPSAPRSGADATGGSTMSSSTSIALMRSTIPISTSPMMPGFITRSIAMVFRIGAPAWRSVSTPPMRRLSAMRSGIVPTPSTTTCSGLMRIPSILTHSMGTQATTAMLPEESRRPCRIGVMVTVNGLVMMPPL